VNILKNFCSTIFTPKKALGMKNQLGSNQIHHQCPAHASLILIHPRAAGGTFQKLFLLFRREKFSAGVLRRAVSQISYPPAK
jgi:hypothetical protein